MAAFVAGGLTVSALLYPSAAEVPMTGLRQTPSQGADLVRGLSGRVATIATNVTAAFEKLDLQEVLHAVEFIARNPAALPPQTVLALTDTYGLGNIIHLVTIVGGSGVAVRSPADIFGGAIGGSGGGVPPSGIDPRTDWAWLWQLLLSRLPAHIAAGTSGVLSSVLSALDPASAQTLMTTMTALTAVPGSLTLPTSVPAPAPAPSAVSQLADVPGPAPSPVMSAPPAPPPPAPIITETAIPSASYPPPPPTTVPDPPATEDVSPPASVSAPTPETSTDDDLTEISSPADESSDNTTDSGDAAPTRPTSSVNENDSSESNPEPNRSEGTGDHDSSGSSDTGGGSSPSSDTTGD
ncbi:hypothetical protein EB72_26865 [Mycobacterium sp. SWH-M1]|nr:hypothetical protein EB72_26865 [Mycobacterium sp. SWH-M1]